VTLLQRLALHFRLNKEVTIRAGSGVDEESETHGFRHWTCENCSEAEQMERGCWIEGRTYVGVPTRIDYTGEDSIDLICVCPRSLADVGLELALERLPVLETSGGLGAYYDVAPSDLPTRATWFYTACQFVKQRWQAQLSDAQTRVHQAYLKNKNP